MVVLSPFPTDVMIPPPQTLFPTRLGLRKKAGGWRLPWSNPNSPSFPHLSLLSAPSSVETVPAPHYTARSITSITEPYRFVYFLHSPHLHCCSHHCLSHIHPKPGLVQWLSCSVPLFHVVLPGVTFVVSFSWELGRAGVF